MKDISELYGDDGLFVKLYGEFFKEEGFSDKGKEIIREIAEYAEKTQLYADLEEQRQEFEEEAKDLTAAGMYGYMCDRIVNAPTSFHRNSSVILLMPIINRKLQEEAETNEAD